MKTIMIGRTGPRREDAEGFIRNVYRARYNADVSVFPAHIIARVDRGDAIVCAAGLRTDRDGFFSERYLDAPVEAVLTAVCGGEVARERVFEVSNLASRAPRATAAFINEIAALGRRSGFQWSFFTLTRRLGVMVERLGVDLTYLADADRRRIADFERWGEYYAHQPRVYAAAKTAIARLAVPDVADVRHAHAV
ncbi:MAG: thermostable hemolysin [Roseiarcus sp.]|jgi:hypothetical protein